MALPDQLKFVEYKPAATAIPVEAINRAYDRMDNIAQQTEMGTNKILQTLAAEMNNSASGDKAYLENMYQQIDTQLNQAVEAGDLPSYSRSIKNMVGAMLRDPMYQAVRQNAAGVKAARDNYEKLSMKFGRENVVMAGDDPMTFSTAGPDGEPRLFMGTPQQRPNYTDSMQDLYMKNVDVVDSRATVDEFVDDFKAFEMYKNTPAGRIHIDEISRELTSQNGGTPLPFLRADDDTQTKAIQIMNDHLKTVGYTFIDTKKQGVLSGDQYKELKGKTIVSSGLAGNTLTDGTDAADQVLMTLDDSVNDTQLDRQLRALFADRRDIMVYQSGGPNGPRRGSKQLDPTAIKNVRLTSNVSTNGMPLLAVTSAGVGQKDQDQMDLVEMVPENLALVRDNMTGFIAQLANSPQSNKLAGIPAMTNIFATDLSVRLRENTPEWNVEVPEAGARVEKDGTGYTLIQYAGPGQERGRVKYQSEKDVRNAVGALILNRKMGL
jgi:hypothetical protein